MKKTIFAAPEVWVCILGIFSVSVPQVWALDDPNFFNQPTQYSVSTSGTTHTSHSCEFEVIAVRNGTEAEGSDGGQLTIRINPCEILEYSLIRFPQKGGVYGTANLQEGDYIIVWDEDAGHGENYNERNFTYANHAFVRLNQTDYEDYLKLESTDPITNWAVYQTTAAGEFAKADSGKNEHEILILSHFAMDFRKEDNVSPDCAEMYGDILYTIYWNNDSGEALENVTILDRLPAGVTYANIHDPNQPYLPMAPGQHCRRFVRVQGVNRTGE